MIPQYNGNQQRILDLFPAQIRGLETL